MGMLVGDEAIEYARKNGLSVFRRLAQADDKHQRLSPDEAADYVGKDPNSIYLVLAYSGFVQCDDGAVLLQRTADNQYGFELCDGESTWAGGIGRTKKVRPIKEHQVPPELREKFDALRRTSGNRQV